MSYKVYDSGYRGSCNKEDSDHKQCVAWIEHNYPDRAGLVFHPANGGKRSAREAAQFKMMGVRAGIPDLIDLNDPLNVAFFELKRKDKTKSRLSKDQSAMLAKLSDLGYSVYVCYGFDEFKKAYEDSLIGERYEDI